MHSYFVQHNPTTNVAKSAAKILIIFRIAKQTCKITHIMRRFYRKNRQKPQEIITNYNFSARPVAIRLALVNITL